MQKYKKQMETYKKEADADKKSIAALKKKKAAYKQAVSIVNNYNLVQNNTSPKALSALDTYRARRQQVSMVKAMTQPV